MHNDEQEINQDQLAQVAAEPSEEDSDSENEVEQEIDPQVELMGKFFKCVDEHVNDINTNILNFMESLALVDEPNRMQFFIAQLASNPQLAKDIEDFITSHSEVEIQDDSTPVVVNIRVAREPSREEAENKHHKDHVVSAIDVVENGVEFHLVSELNGRGRANPPTQPTEKHLYLSDTGAYLSLFNRKEHRGSLLEITEKDRISPEDAQVLRCDLKKLEPVADNAEQTKQLLVNLEFKKRVLDITSRRGHTAGLGRQEVAVLAQSEQRAHALQAAEQTKRSKDEFYDEADSKKAHAQKLEEAAILRQQELEQARLEQQSLKQKVEQGNLERQVLQAEVDKLRAAEAATAEKDLKLKGACKRAMKADKNSEKAAKRACLSVDKAEEAVSQIARYREALEAERARAAAREARRQKAEAKRRAEAEAEVKRQADEAKRRAAEAAARHLAAEARAKRIAEGRAAAEQAARERMERERTERERVEREQAEAKRIADAQDAERAAYKARIDERRGRRDQNFSFG